MSASILRRSWYRFKRLLPWHREYVCDERDETALFKWPREPNYCPFCGAETPRLASESDDGAGRWQA